MSGYTKIKHFGCESKRHKEPLSMCLADTMDRRFIHGGAAGNITGPKSKACQLYMSDRCATKWDGFCEYYYQSPDNRRGRYPNTIQRPWETDFGLTRTMTIGDQLLKNTAERKYCKYINCKAVYEPFDPTNPDSPMIRYFVDEHGRENCIPVCSVEPSTIDTDPVMDRLLSNPQVAEGVLINICNTTRREGKDISKTKIGQYCNSVTM